MKLISFEIPAQYFRRRNCVQVVYVNNNVIVFEPGEVYYSLPGTHIEYIYTFSSQYIFIGFRKLQQHPNKESGAYTVS